MTSQHEQSDSTYGRYEEHQAYTQQRYEPPYEHTPKGETLDDDFVEAVSERIVQRLRQETAGKVYPQPKQLDKNILSMVIAAISMLMLVFFALLFVIVVGGSTGWFSFAIASIVVCLIAAFTIAAVAVDKVK
jgi:hypothetical protein